MSTPFKIYGASKTSRAQMWKLLREIGYSICSTWVDEAGMGETEDYSELWQRILAEIREADYVILYAQIEDFPLKGALVEAGVALAMGKKVCVVLPGVPLEGITYRPIGSWIKHPAVHLFNEIGKAMEFIELDYDCGGQP